MKSLILFAILSLQGIQGSFAFSTFTTTARRTSPSTLSSFQLKMNPIILSSSSSSRSNKLSILQRRSSTLASTSTLSLRRRLLSEDDLAEPPNQEVIDAIDAIGQEPIIASDITKLTGLPLSRVQQSLSALASLTRGDIAVTNDGEMMYTFPPNVSSTLASNSLRYKLTNTWNKVVWPKLFWGIRISFGVFLFISIAAIFSTLIFIQSGGADREDNDGDRNRSGGGGGGGGFGFRYGFGDLLFDIFYPRPYLYSSNYYGYYGRYDPYYVEQYDNDQSDNSDEERGGIFEGIFSYIFGDGNPNRNLEAARLREASRVIRSNGGAVTAEQLAPFCDVEEPDDIMGDDFTIEDEGFVLPIVGQLNGVPTVTDDGDIVYLFPDLQVSAMEEGEGKADSNGAGDSSLNECLQEMTLDFNRNEGIGNIAAGALGFVNLAGALYLGQILSTPTLSGVQLAGFFGLVQAGYPLLLVYAVLFNAIPAARYLNNQRLNEQITKRNSARRKFLTYLQVGGSQVTRKLRAAKSLRQKMKRLVGGADTAYDTRKTIEELTMEKESQDMKKFDKLLGDQDENAFQ